MDGRMLVATDGTEASAGALHAALALTKRGAGPVLVLAVQEPVVLYDLAAPGAMAGAQMELERLGTERLRAEVQARLAEVGGPASGWEVRVEMGSPPAVIADAARRHGAALVLLGLGRHAVADRLFGGETALRVMQLVPLPVLAVHPEARDLPRRVLVAEDFSDFSREAGSLAADLVGPGGELHLAHVLRMPSDNSSAFLSAEWIDAYTAGIREQLEKRRAELEAGAGAGVHVHTRQGDPARELVRLADEIGAELVAAGTHGHGFLGRLLIGSVSTRLVRRAKCSVLVVPARGAE